MQLKCGNLQQAVKLQKLSADDSQHKAAHQDLANATLKIRITPLLSLTISNN